MTKRKDIGNIGEEVACQYLIANKYKILARNFRQKWGEIDIIALAHDKTLVFFEVKTVSGNSPAITAEMQMSHSKIEKTRRTASLYANQNYLLSEKGWRVDLLAVNHVGSEFKIKHYENI